MRQADGTDFSDSLLSLRGIAAIIVLIYHASLAFTITDEQPQFGLGAMTTSLSNGFRGMMLVATNGTACVTLFFVLSGFVLTLSLSRQKRKSMSIGQFAAGYYVRRFFRLWPMAAFSCLALSAYAAAGFAPVSGAGFSDWLGDIPGEAITGAGIRRSLLLQSWGINAALWSLVVEAAGSVLMPVAFFAGKRVIYIAAAFFIAGMVLPKDRVIFQVAGWTVSAIWLQGIFCILLGACLAQSRESIGRLSRLCGGSWATTAAIAALLFARWLFDDARPAITVEAFAAAIIVYNLYRARAGWLQSLCRHRLAGFYGAISFGLYANSLLTVHIAARLLDRLTPSDTIPRHGLLATFACITLALSLGTLLSWLTYIVIERPLMLFGRQFTLAASDPQPAYRLSDILSGWRRS